MPKTKISEYSVTNSSNTDIEGINIDEGCAPSGINNAIRELMVHLKEFQTGASGDAFTFAGGVLISGTANTITGNVLMSGTNTITGSTTATFAAGAVGTPSIAAHGDTNTGIFFPAADTIAFAEGGAEAMRINSDSQVVTTAGTASLPAITTTGDVNTGIFFPAADTIAFAEGGAEAMRITSDGRLGIGTTSPDALLTVNGVGAFGDGTAAAPSISNTGDLNTGMFFPAADTIAFSTGGSERLRMDDNNRLLFGTTSAFYGSAGRAEFDINGSSEAILAFGTGGTAKGYLFNDGTTQFLYNVANGALTFGTNNSERARITSGGVFLVGKNAVSTTTVGVELSNTGQGIFTVSGDEVVIVNRNTNDGTLIAFRQDNVAEGSISVSGNTVSYNSFCGGHWSQLQQGRGYNPEILRGTVMSSIGEMCEWKSVEWVETIEHPAIPAVQAKEAVLDEEGNVVELAVEAVEGKDAWTETIPHREAYLGNLAVGATFTEDGVTKTVVDDGNERLPKVKISDVVGDKAVYGVFQTYDEVQDMLVTSLGAFVVRIAAGVTVHIGDLLESNGDGCAKVQDDDVIRSKTIGKVTSTTPSATYADGSYTVPAVLYCG